MKQENLRIFHNEEFREIKLEPTVKLRYAISNLGRIVSFTDEIKNGRLLKGGMLDGYKILRYADYRDGKRIYSVLFIYKLIALFFIPKSNENQDCVIHLDYCRSNDELRNLKWVTQEERVEHIRKSPHIIQSRKDLAERNRSSSRAKLSESKVKVIKKLLAGPNRKTRIKMIARQFKVSEMQIFRIQSGENWGHVTI